VEPADFEARANQDVAHHPAVREGVVQMQFVDPGINARSAAGTGRGRL